MTAKIMIVDDAPMLRRLVEYALLQEGYAIVLAEDGQEALAKVKSEQPDLVILDVMLPGMSGIEVCQKLRQDPDTATLPIIMLSAKGELDDKVAGLEAGADEYVTKPIQSKELIARVAALLERTQRLRQQAQAPPQSNILGFMGAKGGVGTTTIALNVAAALVQQEKNAIAVEMRSSFGTLSAQVGSAPTDHLGRLLKLAPDQIDERNVKMCLTNHPSGLQLLCGPQQIEDYRSIDPKQAKAIIKQLSKIADHVVIDLPASPTRAGWAALQQCDFIGLVIEPDPSGIAAAKVAKSLLESWGIGPALVGLVVVNPVPLSTPISLEKAVSMLNLRLVGVVPPAADAFLAAQRKKAPLVVYQPEHQASVNLTELASRLTADKIMPIRL